jgi:hypothetical protein
MWLAVPAMAEPPDEAEVRALELEMARETGTIVGSAATNAARGIAGALEAATSGTAAEAATALGELATEAEVAEAVAAGPAAGTGASAAQARVLSELFGKGIGGSAARLANWAVPQGVTRPMLLRYAAVAVSVIRRYNESPKAAEYADKLAEQLRRLEIVRRALEQVGG